MPSEKSKKKHFKKLLKKANRDLFRGEGRRWEAGTKALLKELKIDQIERN